MTDMNTKKTDTITGQVQDRAAEPLGQFLEPDAQDQLDDIADAANPSGGDAAQESPAEPIDAERGTPDAANAVDEKAAVSPIEQVTDLFWKAAFLPVAAARYAQQRFIA